MNRTTCNACRSPLSGVPLLDLGMQPLANNLCDEARRPEIATVADIGEPAEKDGQQPLELSAEQVEQKFRDLIADPAQAAGDADFAEELALAQHEDDLEERQHHSDERFPLRLVRCSVCGLLQLDTVVDPAAMFSHYLYTPSQSKKTLEHFDELAETATRRGYSVEFDAGGFAVDIGSNDGALLAALAKRGWVVAGVDPAENLAAAANAKGLFTVPRFFDREAVDILLARLGGRVELITANNVFAHTPDWKSFLENADLLLGECGQIEFEFPYAPVMLVDGIFDLIYHEHAAYPALTPLQRALGDVGMHIIDVEMLKSIHGGSVRAWVARKDERDALPNVAGWIGAEELTYSERMCESFALRVEKIRREFVEAIAAEVARGQRVVGYTAPAKAVTLLEYCGVAGFIDYIVDDNPLKQDKTLPCSHVPIVPSGRFELDEKTTVVIFAWNVAEDIVSKLPMGVDVIVPMPNLKIIRR